MVVDRLVNDCGCHVELISRSEVKKWAFDTFPEVCLPLISSKIDKKCYDACDIVSREFKRVDTNGRTARKGSFIYVDDKGIQNLLRECDNAKIVMAMKTAPEEIKQKFFKNMSQRAATLLREDFEALGPTKLSDVEKAQSDMVNKVKELESRGKAIIARGSDGDSLV
jgi:Ribonuclease G/E